MFDLSGDVEGSHVPDVHTHTCSLASTGDRDLNLEMDDCLAATS